jgi:hypothetical protein
VRFDPQAFDPKAFDAECCASSDQRILGSDCLFPFATGSVLDDYLRVIVTSAVPALLG